MPRRSRTLTQGRWRAIALSLLLHSGIVVAAVYGWFTWKHRPPPVTTLAIEATVVDERQLKGVAPTPKPEPPPPEPPNQNPSRCPRSRGHPSPTRPNWSASRRRSASPRKNSSRKSKRRNKSGVEAEKQAAAKEAAEKAAAEKAAADKKAAEKKKAEEAAAAKKAADEKARLAREAELRRMLEAEERGNALRNSDEANRWHAQIVARITRAWIRPPSAQPGITCIVLVSQVPGGEVTSVRVDSCSINDAALRESVEAAVYRASPLPPPPNPALFERNLELTFAPQ